MSIPMFHVPTWIIIPVCICTFQFTYMQFMRQASEQSWFSRRYLLLACNFAVMMTTIFANRGKEWVSMTLFGLAVTGAVWSFVEYKMMPAKLPDEPGF